MLGLDDRRFVHLQHPGAFGRATWNQRGSGGSDQAARKLGSLVANPSVDFSRIETGKSQDKRSFNHLERKSSAS